VAAFGSYGYELDLNKYSAEDKAIFKGYSEKYRQYEDLNLRGDLYRLISPENSSFCAYIKVSKDKNKALLTFLELNATGFVESTTLRLKGLDPDKAYKNEGKNAWLSRDVEQVKKYNEDPMCGFTCSMGFYHYFFRGFKAIQKSPHTKLRKDLPLFIISGSDDKVGGNGKLVIKLCKKYQKLGLNPSIKLYKDARHEILNEINKDEVYEDVINFVKSCLPL
jgi:hypothetical protein